MTAIVAWLVGRGLSETLANWLARAALVIVIVLALLVGKCAYDRHVIAQHETSVAAELAPRIAAGADKAAAERAADAIAVQNTTQELTNAVSALPDAPPSPRRIVLGCERLRRAGQALPAACR